MERGGIPTVFNSKKQKKNKTKTLQLIKIQHIPCDLYVLCNKPEFPWLSEATQESDCCKLRTLISAGKKTKKTKIIVIQTMLI